MSQLSESEAAQAEKARADFLAKLSEALKAADESGPGWRSHWRRTNEYRDDGGWTMTITVQPHK